jgi:glycosyltransferase involved in cell wall biosynthesis
MKKAYRQADTYISISKAEIRLMTESIKHDDILRLMDGTDFSFFKPGHDKIKIRIELGLPLTKKIIIYVGRFETAFGMDKILNWFNEFKTRNDQFELLLIGSSNESEGHYQTAKDSKAILIGRIPQELLLRYYQASDISLYPVLDTKLINSGGYGYSNVESSACGLPLVSNCLIHFPGSLEERDKLGYLMPSIEDMEKIILHIADNPDKYKECRGVAEKYFSEENWIKTLLNKYDELFRKHYEK